MQQCFNINVPLTTKKVIVNNKCNYAVPQYNIAFVWLIKKCRSIYEKVTVFFCLNYNLLYNIYVKYIACNGLERKKKHNYARKMNAQSFLIIISLKIAWANFLWFCERIRV